MVRNKLYDWKVFKSVRFNLPVICVGNLVVGGSGKSPVTEYLVDLLAGKKIAILSRGYGRVTKGFLLADKNSTSLTIGDEPLQFYSKFPEVTVAVCEDRVKGINKLLDDHDVVILDDAFQHRAVTPGYNILLFEYDKLLKKQYLLPAGNLREPFNGYRRAQSIMVTKTPERLDPAKKLMCTNKFENNFQKNLLFSTLSYQDLISFNKKESRSCESIKKDTVVFLWTGIANPKPLISYLSGFPILLKHQGFPDHHQFTRKELMGLIEEFKSDTSIEKMIITTEKDVQRLLNAPLKELLLNLPVFYLPVKIKILNEDKLTFDQKILNYVSITTRDRTIHQAKNR
jgi:tetraacyldisaccharide 4'-kinase